MSTATADKPISKSQVRAIHTLWREVSPGVAELSNDRAIGPSGDLQSPNHLITKSPNEAERAARLAYISQILMRPIATSKDLSKDEAQRVIERMKQEVGQDFRPAGYRGARKQQPAVKGSWQEREPELGDVPIAQVAAELFGQGWQENLAARTSERFGAGALRALTGGQRRSLVEELLQRIAVRNIKSQKPGGGALKEIKISRKEIEREKARLRGKFFGHGDAEKTEEEQP